MRVAAYVRVSTDEQADKGNSLSEQKERLEGYCKAMGWPEPIFFIDEGYSAKDMKRPCVQKLLTRVKKNEFDVVLTTKLDRMSRNLLDMLQLIKLLGEHDCNYVSSSEQFDTSTAVGRMVLQLLATFAEFERGRNSERVKDNMMSLARNTDKVLTGACYGYDIVDGKYAINEEEARFVTMMFDLAEQGHGFRMIAKSLNEHGSKTKRDKSWDQTNIKRIIRNETIAGVMTFNKRENKNGKTVIRNEEEWIVKQGNHPAIISHDRMKKVWNIMESRKKAKKHADNESYILTGLVKCNHCGRNMKGNTARVRRDGKAYDYYRYVCSSYINGYDCKYHAVHRSDIETLIVNEIKRIVESSPEELNITIAPTTINVNEIENIKSQLANINKRIQKQIEAYENDLISAVDLKEASKRAENERLELNFRLEIAENQKVNASDLQNNAKGLIGDITGVDRVKAKTAIRQLIEEIKLSDGALVDVIWKSLV